MPLDKRPSADGTVTVIFRVPAELGASTAEILGDFTEWVPAVMQPADGGGFELALELRAGTAYRFRYLIDGERWENDWAADAYVANDYGSDDSIVDLSPAPAAQPVKKAAAKATKTAKKATEKKAPAKKAPAKKAPAAKAPRKKSSSSE